MHYVISCLEHLHNCGNSCFVVQNADLSHFSHFQKVALIYMDEEFLMMLWQLQCAKCMKF